MMDSERAGVLLAAILIDLRLMHNDFCMAVFHAFSAP